MLRRLISAFVGGVALIALGLLAAPATAPATTAAPVTFLVGCDSDIPGEGFVITDIYDTCQKCNAAGADGLRRGFWTAYRCRQISWTVLLYTKV